MPPKRKHDPGYKLPEVIEPDENCCICIPIPNDFNHKMAFLGQLDELGYWWNWERDPDKKGRETAAVWRKIVECIREEMDMSGCGCSDDKPTNSRINPETGIYEESYDGGITWTPAPQNDPRSSGVLFPAIPGGDGGAKKCTAANSVVSFLIEMQDVEHGQLEANATIADAIIAVLAALSAIGIFLAFVPAAVFALVAFVVGTFGHLIAADFEALFDEPVWDALLCVLYCNMNDDGSFTEAQWQAIKAQVKTDIPGYAGQWVSDHINLIGVVGLTNAARASYPGSRSCEGCDCLPYCEDADSWFAGTVNSTTDNGDGTITFNVSSVDNGAGTQYIAWGNRTEVGAPCCEFLSFVPTTAFGIIGGAVQLCGSNDEFPDFPVGGNCYKYFHVYQDDALGTPFTADVTFTACTE